MPTVSAPELLEAGVDAAYQPIVHLGSGAVIAYEALARPRDPTVTGPLEFFAVLEASGLRLAGERVAFAAALRGARAEKPRTKLFLNASPSTLVDCDFDVLELVHLAEEYSIATPDLVVEVTESEAVEDLETLALRTRRLRRLGIGIAVDDAGAGHASFRVITRLRPSWIKVDRDLVSGVDSDGARHAFIEAMVRFARQIGSRLIAEGIETEGELASLAGLGVEAGQGFFLSRPRLGAFGTPSAHARRVLAQAAQRLHLGDAQVTVRELARPAVFVDPTISVREAQLRFSATPSLFLVLLREERGVSQVTRRALERLLAAPETGDWFADRPLAEVADHEPVTVPADLDVREAGSILAARRVGEVTDDFLVTDAHGDLIGVATARDVLRGLTEVRRHGERDLHPLSGLPGSAWVEAELGRRLERGDPVTLAVVDIDGFKAVNHLGGYALGDEVIRALARCLTGVTAGVLDATAAHAGGDDFLILVPPRGFSELLAAVVRAFEGEVMPMIRTQLRLHAAGQAAAGVGISVAAVDLDAMPPSGRRHLDWAGERLAQLVQMAKSEPGYVSAHRSGDDVTLSSWTPREGGQRTVSLGLVEPDLVLRALLLVGRETGRWLSSAESNDIPLDRFPGPREEVDALWAAHAEPLRAAAAAAKSEGTPVIEVALRGEEEEILAILDRIALVTQSLWASPTVPVPPELGLLDRMLRQRSRAIIRRDVLTSVAAKSDAVL